MKSIQVIQLINQWKSNCYLSNYSFDCPAHLIDDALSKFQSDYNRWYEGVIDIKRLSLTPQLQTVLCYRIANNVYKNGVADLYSLLGRVIGQIEIYYSSEIGEGFRINHGVGTVIGARAHIGDNFTIHQNCTIGDKNGGRPTIGNNVTMYAGSLILGSIHIGDNSVIGANALVMSDFPSNAILVGTPAINKR